ncbi:hypothetical protein ACX0K2_04545 [Pseudomonas extremorientalis]
MAITNNFFTPPNITTVPCCTSSTTPPTPQPTAVYNSGAFPNLFLTSAIRCGSYVVAQVPSANGTETIAGYLADISADGNSATIQDIDTTSTTTVNPRFIGFYATVNDVSIYPAYSSTGASFTNNFNAPVNNVFQGQQSGYFRSVYYTTTKAFQSFLRYENVTSTGTPTPSE